MAGYSKRTLVEKLGIGNNQTITILNAPDGYEQSLGKKSLGVKLAHTGGDIARHLRNSDTFTFIHYFARSQEDLKEKFPILKNHLAKTGMLWISWPKGAYCNFVGSDLTENIIRDIGLAEGLVDVKVIVVDENWSGLKFVYRLEDR